MRFSDCFNGTTIEYFNAVGRVVLMPLYSFPSLSTKFYELGDSKAN